MKYKDKLKHPKWQKKRLEVFERDDFRCQLCWDNNSTLHVHHKYYKKARDPWAYQLKAFITLCEKCHNKIHKRRPEAKTENIPIVKEDEAADEKARIAARDKFYKKYGTKDSIDNNGPI